MTSQCTFLETFGKLLMSADERLSRTLYSPSCHWAQFTLLRQTFYRPGWFVRDRRLTILTTSSYTQSLQKIVPMGFVRSSVSATSSSKDTQGTRSHQSLLVDCGSSLRLTARPLLPIPRSWPILDTYSSEPNLGYSNWKFVKPLADTTFLRSRRAHSMR